MKTRLSCLSILMLAVLLGGCDETLVRLPDTAPPSVLITYPVPGVVLHDAVEVLIEAADPDSIASVSLLVDGQLIGTDTAPPWRISWPTSYWHDEAIHSLVAKAVDRSGNVGLSTMVLATLDTAALPGPRLDPTQDDLTFDTLDPRLAWTAFAGAAGYQIEVVQRTILNETLFTFESVTPATTISLYSGGEYAWRVRAVGPLGLTSPWSTSRTFRIDIPETPDALLASFFTAYTEMDINRYDLLLHADFRYRFIQSGVVDRVFDRADELTCAGHIFSGVSGQNRLGDPYAAVESIDISYFNLDGQWTSIPANDPLGAEFEGALSAIYGVGIEVRSGSVTFRHATLEKFIVVPVSIESSDVISTRWFVHSQQELQSWPLKADDRLWSELKLDYF